MTKHPQHLVMTFFESKIQPVQGARTTQPRSCKDERKESFLYADFKANNTTGLPFRHNLSEMSTVCTEIRSVVMVKKCQTQQINALDIFLFIVNKSDNKNDYYRIFGTIITWFTLERTILE